MTEIITAEIVDTVRFNDEQKAEAVWIRAALNNQLGAVGAAEHTLAMGYARIGSLLLKIRTHQYWRLWGFPTFKSYIASVREVIDKGRTQIYECIGVAEKLLPFVSEIELNQMGISKARELRRVMVQTGRPPSDAIVAKAVQGNVGLQELRAAIFEETHVHPEHHGSYYDLGGFYATKEEREEIERTFNLARSVDPVIKNELPEWAQKKEIIMRLCQEFWSEYGTVLG